MGKSLRSLAVLLGVALIVVGAPLFLTPFPGGLACIAAGAALIVSFSPHAQRFMRRERKRHPKLNGRLNTLEEHVPRRVRRPLEKTRPD